MGIADVVTQLYLPLLTQETAVMISTFTYGLKAGMSSVFLAGLNTAAVITDLGLFFLPSYLLSERLHTFFERRYERYYQQARRLSTHIGVFRTSTVLAFVMPSVAAMIVVGLLRLAFWRALAGLFIGSAVYVVIPLLLALPLAATLPTFVVPVLRWIAPAIALLLVLSSIARSWSRGDPHKV